ncbi:MAG: hypothetical protein PHQ12_09705 [Chthoniobacteraceae bacterium]|nr:hypothetical protein [Chthoniobacteraceae bacterium]
MNRLLFMWGKNLSFLFVPVIALMAGCATLRALEPVVPVPAIPGVPASSAYSVKVNGQDVAVNDESRFDFHTAAFCMAGTVNVEIRVPGATNLKECAVVPEKHQIILGIRGGTVRFVMKDPAKLIVLIPGKPRLALLATPLETDVPSARDANVVYFGPGTHEAGVIRPRSGQTVYLAPGALVKGRIEARNVQNVTVRGRGTLDAGECSIRARKTHGILFDRCSQIKVEGIGFRAGSWWQSLYLNSDHVSVAHMNLMGKEVNTDGVDIDGVKDFRVSDCFIRCGDDGLGWHGLDAKANGETITERAVADNLVIWQMGAGNGLRIGASMEDQMWRDITVKNTDIWSATAIFSDLADWSWVENLRFENIHITNTGGAKSRPITMKIFRNRYSNDNGFLDERGHFDGLVFDHVTMDGGAISLLGFDAAHKFDNVYFNGCTNGNKPVGGLEDIVVNDYVTNVRFNQPVPPSATPAPGLYEAEYTDTQTNVIPQITYADAQMSNGKGKMLKAEAAGAYVAYLVHVPAPGAYGVKVRMKKTPASGKFQFSVNGADLLPPQDLYASADTYQELDFGTATFPSGGVQTLKCAVTGKDAASAGYRLDVDYLKLTPAAGAR